jgi:hypothetical protein
LWKADEMLHLRREEPLAVATGKFDSNPPPPLLPLLEVVRENCIGGARGLVLSAMLLASEGRRMKSKRGDC